METQWIICPNCGSKTRDKIRKDTELKNFPLFCPKCKKEMLVNVTDLKISVMKTFYGMIVYHYAAIIYWLFDCFATRGIVGEETYYRVLSYVVGKMEHAVLGLMKRTDYKRFHASIVGIKHSNGDE